MTKSLNFCMFLACGLFTLHICEAKYIEWIMQCMFQKICYGFYGTGIESRWRARFSAPVQTHPGAHWASYTLDTESYPGIKRPERGVNHPPLSRAEVKERVKLYAHSLSVPSWQLTAWPFTSISYVSTLWLFNFAPLNVLCAGRRSFREFGHYNRSAGLNLNLGS
jgi:hypothetical protein